MPEITIAILVIFFLLILVLVPNIKMLAPHHVMIIERLGIFHRVLKRPGIYFLIPFFERVIQVVSTDLTKNTIKLTESVIEVSLECTYQVNNPKLFVYAALDSEKTLETAIKNEYLSNPIDLKLLIEKMKQVALDLGIELIDINI